MSEPINVAAMLNDAVHADLLRFPDPFSGATKDQVREMVEAAARMTDHVRALASEVVRLSAERDTLFDALLESKQLYREQARELIVAESEAKRLREAMNEKGGPTT